MVAAAKPAAVREKIRKNLQDNGLHVFQGGDVRLDKTITCPARYQAGMIRVDRPTSIYQGPPGSGPVFRLPGADMKFQGNGQLYIYANGVDPVFEVEGCTAISTGWHKFEGFKVLNSPKAGIFATLKGRYEYDAKSGTTGKFVEDEAHADNCVVEDCHFYGKNYTGLLLNNQQSMKWTFNRGSFNIISDEDAGDIVGAEIIRGGIVKFYDTMLNNPRFSWFKPHGANPNTNLLIARNFERDVPTTDNAYLRLLDDSLIPDWVGGWEAGLWILKVSGYVPRHEKIYDERTHFVKGFYNKRKSVIEIDINGDAPKPK